MGPFFMGPVNTRVVRRSAALLGYGHEFHYQEYLRVGGGMLGGAAATSLAASMGAGQAAMGFSAVRRLAGRVAPKPGEGPSEAAMNAGSFRCELVARSAAGNMLRGRISDQGDPGNRATTKMLCEAALALAMDTARLPDAAGAGGVLTPRQRAGPDAGRQAARRWHDAGGRRRLTRRNRALLAMALKQFGFLPGTQLQPRQAVRPIRRRCNGRFGVPDARARPGRLWHRRTQRLALAPGCWAEVMTCVCTARNPAS